MVVASCLRSPVLQPGYLGPAVGPYGPPGARWGCTNTAHVLTFACLSIWLQRESNRAAAPHAGGSVLTRPVTASVVHCTCLWGGEGRDRDAQFPQASAYHFFPIGETQESGLKFYLWNPGCGDNSRASPSGTIHVEMSSGDLGCTRGRGYCSQWGGCVFRISAETNLAAT